MSKRIKYLLLILCCAIFVGLYVSAELQWSIIGFLFGAFFGAITLGFIAGGSYWINSENKSDKMFQEGGKI